MATASKVSLVNTLTIEQRRRLLDYAKLRVSDQRISLGNFRTLLRYRDKAYQRELNTTAEQMQAVRANLEGRARGLQDMSVPIIMPQVESATAYQTGVFLTSYPIFGVVALPAMQSQALQFETALGDQSIRYGWTRELIKVIRNGFKYNFGPACVMWKKEALKQIVTSTDISAAGMAAIKEYSYGGNNIHAIDPYNCFMDMTVDPACLHTDGEFFGWNELHSRVRLKRLLSVLDSAKTTSAREAYESSFVGATGDVTSGMQYHVPDINPYTNIGSQPLPGTTNWGAWMGLTGSDNTRNRIAYKDNYVVTHFFCRAVPSDFGATGNQIKVYHAIIVNWSHVVYVEEMNVGHDYLPCVVMQPLEDGLGYQTKSMLDNAMPFQDMSSSLWNIALASKRRLLFDRLVYNPKMIDKKDIDPASAVSRIPLRNVNLGKDGNEMARALYQIPYREDNLESTIQMSDMVSSMADQAAGQNKVDRGQFQKGNKTKTEFDTTMQNSNARQQLAALTIEQQFMTPVKEMVKSNTLQYQTSGKILNPDQKRIVDVNPIELREAMLAFKMTDGMLPADKMLNSEVLTVFMQTAQAIPGAAAEYDVLGMFIYWAKLRGAYWIEDFKRSPDQQNKFLQTVQGMTAAQEPPQPPAAAA